MSNKYAFKNPEVEKALRIVAKELGFSNEKFDEIVKNWCDARSNCVYFVKGSTRLFSFSTTLVTMEFDPKGWNNSDVIPPEDETYPGTSRTMLVENEDGWPEKGYYDFREKKWFRSCSREEIECSRYRTYPYF